MNQSNVDPVRLMRFGLLFQATFNEALDVDEFFGNDVYALSVIHRAANTDNADLRNLAAHLEIERQASVEPVTLKDADPLGKTWKLGTLPTAANSPQPAPARRRERSTA